MSTWIEQEAARIDAALCAEPEHPWGVHHHTRDGKALSAHMFAPIGVDDRCPNCDAQAPRFVGQQGLADEWWRLMPDDERVALCNREHERKAQRRDALARLASDIDDDTPPDEVPGPTRAPMPPIHDPETLGRGEPICECGHDMSDHFNPLLGERGEPTACFVREHAIPCTCVRFEARA